MLEEAGEVVSAITTTVVIIERQVGIFKAALDEPEVPQPNTPLDDLNPNVKVFSRNAKITGFEGEDNVVVTIEIEYQLQRPETDAGFALSGGASLTSIETQRDRNGDPIVVTYNDESYIATVNVLEPQGNFTREVTYATNTPDTLVSSWVGFTNDALFRGFDAGDWLCTGVTYELKDRSVNPISYLFTFTFERRRAAPDSDRETYAGGWTYTASFRDADGNIPIDAPVVDIVWFPSRDFGDFFS